MVCCPDHAQDVEEDFVWDSVDWTGSVFRESILRTGSVFKESMKYSLKKGIERR